MNLDQIKQLREETGAGVMAARKALEEANGDMEKAKEIIRATGVMKAESKGERSAQAGFIYSYIHGNQKIGVLLELNCETDFVAKTDEFQQLAKELAMQVAAMNPGSLEALMDQPNIRDASKNIQEVIREVIAKVGENIVLRRFVRFELGEALDLPESTE